MTSETAFVPSAPAGTAERVIQRIEDANAGGFFHCEADREEAIEIVAEEISAALASTAGAGAGDLARLRKAVESLNGSKLWLDNNHPWRIMLTRGRFNAAVAEKHEESAPGDGEWSDGASICAIVNEAIRLCQSPAVPASPRSGAGEGEGFRNYPSPLVPAFIAGVKFGHRRPLASEESAFRAAEEYVPAPAQSPSTSEKPSPDTTGANRG